MSDDQLMKRVARGDSAAFRTLFDRHAGKVFGYAKRIVSDSAKAEDISQEVWMKIVSVASAYTPTNQFVPWLLTIVRNTAFNQLRAAKVTREDAPVDQERFEENVEDVSRESVEQLLIEKADQKKIRAIIDELPETQRILLVTWMTEDLTYEELSRHSGKSIQAVKSILFRAKKTLEQTLKGVK